MHLLSVARLAQHTTSIFSQLYSFERMSCNGEMGEWIGDQKRQ